MPNTTVKELDRISVKLQYGSFEESWHALSTIIEIDLQELDFEGDEGIPYVSISRKVLNPIMVCLSQDFFCNHPHIDQLKRIFESWNNIVNAPGDDGAVAMMNVHDARLAPVRQRGRDYLEQHAKAVDEIIAKSDWLEFYKRCTDEIGSIDPDLKDYMIFLYDQEKECYESTPSYSLCVSLPLVKAWYLTQNKHGDHSVVIDSTGLLNALKDSSKAYDNQIGAIFPDLPYSCHPGAQERVETEVGAWVESHVESYKEKSNFEKYSESVSNYVSHYFCLLGKDPKTYSSKKYNNYTVNEDISRYVMSQSAIYQYENDDFTKAEIGKKIIDDIFELHLPVSEGFLFYSMFGRDEAQAKLKLEELIDPLFEIEETIGEDEFTQALAVKKAMEAEIKEKVKTVQEIYSAVAKARAILPNIQQELIFSTIDEVGTLIGLDQSEGLQEIFFKRMSLEIYQKSLDDERIYDSLKIDQSHEDFEKMFQIAGKPECLQHFLSLDINTLAALNIKNNYGFTLLHYALVKEPVEILPMLLASDKVTIEALSLQENTGWTPLHFALAKEPVEILPMLLASDKITIDALSVQNNNGDTPLHLALAEEPVEILPMLLASDKVTIEALNIKDNDGNTPLHWALHKESVETLPMLLASDKVTIEALNIKDNYGWTPFHFALAKELVEILPMLLASDKITIEALNIKDNNGWTPLCYVLDKNINQTIKLVNDEKLQLKDCNRWSCHYALFTSGEWIFQLRVLADIIVRFYNWCRSYFELTTSVLSKPAIVTSSSIINVDGMALLNQTQSANSSEIKQNQSANSSEINHSLI